MDPTGSLEVNFLGFCRAAQKLRLNDIDAALLFGADSPNEMTLDELDPEMGHFVYGFRRWMTEGFGGPSEMFTVLEPPVTEGGKSEGKITKKEFVQGVLGKGFDATEELVSEIFNLLDMDSSGHLDMEDVMFLDMDPKAREGAIQKMRIRPRIEHEHLMATLFQELKSKNYRDGHRLAPRGWHAPNIDKLPLVALEKRIEHKDRQHVKRSESYCLFKRHLDRTYGNGVRAWRKGLAPGGTFGLTRAAFLQYCRRLNLEFDYKLLWSILDRDNDGTLSMEEVSPQAASSLARLWHWTRLTFGGSKFSWKPIMKVARPPPSWKSHTSLKYNTFLDAIQTLGWTSGGLDMEGASLCLALDKDGCGIISKADLEWLDGWTAPEWLYCSSDKEAWLQLSHLLIKRYLRPLSAWRHLDQDDSNNASWDEFVELCAGVGFEGSRGGAWRYLDRDISGTITMQEWHQDSAELLASFKEFLDNEFGSVKLAFERIDTDNSGNVTYSELRRACKRRGWTGNVKLIFKCLDICMVPGMRSLSYKDVSFLDSWQPELDESILDGHHTEEEVEEDEAEKGQGRQKVPYLSSTAAPSTSLGDTLSLDGSFMQLPSVSRPGTPAEASARDWAIPTPTLSELVADAFDAERRRKTELSASAGAGGVRKFGMGCLRPDTIEHMRKELGRLTRAQTEMQKQHQHFKTKARQMSTPLLKCRPGTEPLPKVRPVTSDPFPKVVRRPYTSASQKLLGERPVTTDPFPKVRPHSSVWGGGDRPDESEEEEQEDPFPFPPKAATAELRRLAAF